MFLSLDTSLLMGDPISLYKLADPMLKLLSAHRAGEIKHEKLE
jgi:hypothetical protein